MNKSEVVKALKTERDDLQARIAAIDNALVGFGVRPVNGDKPKRKVNRNPEAIKQFEEKLLSCLKQHGGWMPANELAILAEVPLNGTLYNALSRLFNDDRVLRRGEGRFDWKYNDEKKED